MSVELFDYAPPFGGEVLVSWLSVLRTPANVLVPVRRRRKSNDPLPQRIVTRIGGPADQFTDTGEYSIHDFGNNFTAVEDASRLTLRRIMALGPPFSPQREVTITGGTAVVDRIQITEAPHEEFFSETIERFVMTVRVDLRFVQQ